MPFSPYFWTTHVGSLPHRSTNNKCRHLIATLDIPAWPQWPRRSFRESMYVQYSASLPAITVDETREKITFNTQDDFTSALEDFYERYLADDVNAFALRPSYAQGFFCMLENLRSAPGQWVKGQVTGPISFGLTVTDQDLRASLYNEMLADVIVKNMAMNARWQIRQLKSLRPQVLIFVDEPYMASFGSAFISLSREQVISMLNEIFEAIHLEGGLAGVHCCANTDWSVLLETQVDILNLDAYGYLENLALYPSELRRFLDRGGVVAWGIIPNNEGIYQVTAADLAIRLRQGFNLIAEKAQGRGVDISPEEFENRSLLTPSCGLGSATEVVSDQVLHTLTEVAKILRGEI